jgi:hypothetical protein
LDLLSEVGAWGLATHGSLKDGQGDGIVQFLAQIDPGVLGQKPQGRVGPGKENGEDGEFRFAGLAA